MNYVPQTRLFAPVTKRIVLLADSPMRSGFQCLAGREVQWERAALKSVGPWVRLISPRGEWLQGDVRLDDGTLPKLCDIVDVPLEYTSRHPAQPEDRVVVPEFRWAHVGRLSTAYLGQIEQTPATLWHARKRNPNRLNVQDADAIAHLQTLLIIRPQKPVLHVWSEVEAPNAEQLVRRRVQFTYHGVEYSLPITDRRIVDETEPAPLVGTLPIVTEAPFAKECLFTVDLTRPFGRVHHKVVVGVINM